MNPALQAELDARNAAHAEEFWLLLTEAQALDLASGYVPLAVKAIVTNLLDRQDDLRRAAERPIPTPKRKGGRGKRSEGPPG